MKKKNDDFDNLLDKELKSKKVALSYLNEAYRDNDLDFLIKCIKDVIVANGGFTNVSVKAGVSRTSLYSALSGKKTPSIHHIENILHTLGLSFSIVPLPHDKSSVFVKAA